MSAVAIEILIIGLLVVVNGVFAMSEMAVVAARRARLQQRAAAGEAGARAALELANAPNRFLSTVQIGITLIGILTGAFGGATVARELAARLSLIPWLAPHSDAAALGIVVLSITYLSLVVGELVPKRLALSNAEGIAVAVAAPMRLLSLVAAPAVHLLSLSTELVLGILGIRPSREPPVTDEEIKILMEQGIRSGVFEAAEQDIVENVFRLSDRRVSALMTPRPDIIWLDQDAAPEESWQKMAASGHTRFPVCRGDLDHVVGIVSVKDVWARGVTNHQNDLTVLLRQPQFVLESVPALKLLETFEQSGAHLALVIDEYGGIQGLVTLDDILRGIVGRMPSAEEPEEPRAVRRDDGSWLMDGMLPIHEFKDVLDIRQLPGEKQKKYNTLAGFILMYLGRIPAVADDFVWNDLHFEVVDMDGRRVDKVLVTPLAAEPPAATEGA